MTREEYDEDIKNIDIPFAHTVSKYIVSLESTISSQEIIIKDKTAFMEAMAQTKTCEGCKYNRFGCDSLGHATDCILDYKACQRCCYDYYEPKA